MVYLRSHLQETLWKGRTVRQLTMWTSGAQSCWEASEELWKLRDALESSWHGAGIREYLSIISHPSLVSGSSGSTNYFLPTCLNWLRFSYGQQMPSDWEEVTGVYRIHLHTTSSVGQGEANGYRVYQRNTTQQKWSRSRSSNGSNFIRCANKNLCDKGNLF